MSPLPASLPRAGSGVSRPLRGAREAAAARELKEKFGGKPAASAKGNAGAEKAPSARPVAPFLPGWSRR